MKVRVPPQQDVISVLLRDHREVESLFEQLDRLPAGDPERRDLVSRVTLELIRHSVAEELYLYPVMRSLLADGAEIATRALDDHADLEELLRVLQCVEVGKVEFDFTLAQLMREVRDHVRNEEGKLFPRLRAAADPASLRELGASVEEARRWAPTRR